MKVIKEFKEFAMKGNVVDLATGVIIGAAFGKIVTSLVNDIIMPVFGLFTGKGLFKNIFIPLDGRFGVYKTLEEAQASTATINLGLFLTNIVDFLIIAFAIFLMVKQINKLKPKAPAAVSSTKICPYCQSSVHIKAIKCPHCTSQLDRKSVV